MTKIKAVIFDMDGLIVDTELIESQSLSKVISGYGKTPVLNDTGLVHVVGKAENSYTDLMHQYSITEELDVFRNKKREIFSKLLEEQLTPYDGFFELLELLSKHNLKIALASNRYINHIFLVLKNLDVEKFFNVIVGPNEERKHKPHPDIYLHAAKELGLNPENCVALEDSESGVMSAHSAGMKVIAIPNKYTHKHDFSKADIISKSLSDISLELLESL